jgi:hypothetical protein
MSLIKIDKDKLESKRIEGVENARRNAYTAESDPLFFKYQRGEIEKEVWVNKVDEIKSRYPK